MEISELFDIYDIRRAVKARAVRNRFYDSVDGVVKPKYLIRRLSYLNEANEFKFRQKIPLIL